MNLGGEAEWLALREIDPEIRLELIENGLKYQRQGLEHAKKTGSTHAAYHLSVATARTLSFLSSLKEGKEKIKLLEEALAIAEKGVYYTQQLRPYFYLFRGGSYMSLSRTQSELSNLEENYERKSELI